MATAPAGDMATADAATVGSDLKAPAPVFSFGAAGSPLTLTYANANGVSVGDFNGDGKTDLFIVDSSPIISANAGYLDALSGNGDGSFAYVANHGFSGPGGITFTAADVNRDGKTDGVYYYVLSSYNPKTHVTTYTPIFGFATSNGDGTFTSGGFTPAPSNFGSGIYVVDLNNDHAVEVLTVSQDSSANRTGFSVFLNNGSNGMARSDYLAPTYPVPASGLVAQDLTGDGKADVFYAAQNQGVLVVGNGDGTMATAPITLSTGLAANLSVAAADLNSDGRPDLIVGQDGNSVTVFLALAAGGFAAANTYASQGSAYYVAAADFNGDGLNDIVTCDRNNLTFLLNEGNGFGAPKQIAQSCGPIAVGDFNGDKLPDLALRAGGGVVVMLNTTH